MWPSEDGQWLVYGSLNTSGCHQLGYIDYQEDQSDANSIRYSIVSPSSLHYHSIFFFFHFVHSSAWWAFASHRIKSHPRPKSTGELFRIQ